MAPVLADGPTSTTCPELPLGDATPCYCLPRQAPGYPDILTLLHFAGSQAPPAQVP